MKTRTSILSLAVALAFAGSASANAASAPAATQATPAVMTVAATPATTATPVTPPESTKASDPMNEADVRMLLTSKGFTEINDVAFKEGTWTADAESADGKHVEMRIDSATGKVIPDEVVATIGKDAIIAKVLAAGYTNVHDVEMEGGVWKVEADNSKGQDVELKLDPNDGHILGSKKDMIGDNR